MRLDASPSSAGQRVWEVRLHGTLSAVIVYATLFNHTERAIPCCQVLVAVAIVNPDANLLWIHVVTSRPSEELFVLSYFFLRYRRQSGLLRPLRRLVTFT